MEGVTRETTYILYGSVLLSPYRSEDTIRSPSSARRSSVSASPCKACMCVQGWLRWYPTLGSGPSSSGLVYSPRELGPMDIFTKAHFKLEPLELEYKSSKGEE